MVIRMQMTTRGMGHKPEHDTESAYVRYTHKGGHSHENIQRQEPAEACALLQ